MDTAGTLHSRAEVNDSPEGLEIVIPAPRVWPVIVFLAFWLAGWVTGEAFALQQILAPSPAPAKVFLAVWLAFWTVGGLFALGTCVWMLVGHERVHLRPDVLTIRREAFGLGPVTTYALDRVRGLTAQPLPALPSGTPSGVGPADGRGTVAPEKAAGVLRVVGIGGPGILFRYGDRPVRFGLALDPLEARMVVGQLRSRHDFGEDRHAA